MTNQMRYLLTQQCFRSSTYLCQRISLMHFGNVSQDDKSNDASKPIGWRAPPIDIADGFSCTGSNSNSRSLGHLLPDWENVSMSLTLTEEGGSCGSTRCGSNESLLFVEKECICLSKCLLPQLVRVVKVRHRGLVHFLLLCTMLNLGL